jgi:hypothetical protein
MLIVCGTVLDLAGTLYRHTCSGTAPDLLRLVIFFVRDQTSSVAEQADLFQAARVVVGVSGAGLTNTIYCEKGTVVLELLPARENIGNGLSDQFPSRSGYTYYWQLSQALQLQHWVLALDDHDLNSRNIVVQRIQFKRALGSALDTRGPRPLPRELRLWWESSK